MLEPDPYIMKMTFFHGLSFWAVVPSLIKSIGDAGWPTPVSDIQDNNILHFIMVVWRGGTAGILRRF